MAARISSTPSVEGSYSITARVRVKVDQGCRHACALVERLLDERDARTAVHPLHRQLGNGDLSTGFVWGS